MSSGILFRLLGSLDVRIGDRQVELASAGQQVIMAMLLLEANHVVTMNRLIDAVWDEDPPATAKSQIQICVSALRRLLDDDSRSAVISTRSPGYILNLPDEALDIRQFEILAARGRAAAASQQPAQAVAALRSPLALWRRR